MEASLIGVLIGAAAASVVPLVIQRSQDAKWRTEKRVEELRAQHVRLEKMYEDILEQLADAIERNAYPSTMTGKISARASAEVRKLYFDYVFSKNRDPAVARRLYLKVCVAAQKHLAELERKIEQALE